MDCKSVDRLPNYEHGTWDQTTDRWENEGLERNLLTWEWWLGEDYFNIDKRANIDVDFGMTYLFDEEIIEETDRYLTARNSMGVVTKSLKEGASKSGASACMDQYISFPVTDAHNFHEFKKRYTSDLSYHIADGWKNDLLPLWKNRSHVLSLGLWGSIPGFYWNARGWMGTENICYAWYDQPALMHEIMEFIADFTIEVAKPILAETGAEYVCLNEDYAMKTAPLLSPEQYKIFIFPHMRRLADFFKGSGIKYVFIDSDGDCDLLLPLMMEAGVDGIMPLERAAGMDPVKLRKKYGKSLKLLGGVDKRAVAKGKDAIEKHLTTLVSLIEEGGFIPTVDHLVSPDISLENFEYYMKRKIDLLNGKY